MIIVDGLSQLRAARSRMEGSFGLVPTMGALHEGHLSLVRKARTECNHVGVSIFINPTQFGPMEDFARYPRDLNRDLELLRPLGVDLVWTPTPEMVYEKDFQTWINVEGITVPLEGKLRPGHFRGVATVVAKLFNAFMPARAYFGQKDAQQTAVIRRMVRDLNFPVEVAVCPTVREQDGLAMSSRNVHLDCRERCAATVLFRALSAAKILYLGGERDANLLRSAMRRVLDAEPQTQVDYVSAADPDTMSELDQVKDRVLLSLATRIGKTRLIDNFLLPE